MTPLSEFEQRIYNEGERLIPGITHNLEELIRHRNSYMFWKRIIEHDVATGNTSDPIRILDLGSGVGHGCVTLAEIPGTEVVGIDNEAEVIAYARSKYPAPNITYEVADIVAYVKSMTEFDYVVSRGVLEHIPDGLTVARDARWSKRLMFDVPYQESEGNPHHVLHFIGEQDFGGFDHAELFYQDLQGVTYDHEHKPERANMIMCVARTAILPAIADAGFTFPDLIWQPKPDDPLWEWERRNRATLTVQPPLPKRVIGKLQRIARDLLNRS